MPACTHTHGQTDEHLADFAIVCWIYGTNFWIGSLSQYVVLEHPVVIKIAEGEGALCRHNISERLLRFFLGLVSVQALP